MSMCNVFLSVRRVEGGTKVGKGENIYETHEEQVRNKAGAFADVRCAR